MFWYQGKLGEGDSLNINITDSGLLYGATVFTTMRVYNHDLNHSLTHWSLHKKRLMSGLNDFGWEMPNWNNIITGINHLIGVFPIIRIAIFSDGKELITGRNLPDNLREKQQHGIVGYVAKNKHLMRSLPSYKTGNYLAPFLALKEAQKNAAQEAILIDKNGNWLETSTGNLWGYKKGVYYTPSLDCGILAGIIRQQLISYLKQQNIPIIENIWTPEFIQELELMCYSNCAVEIIPFKQIKDHPNYNPNVKYLDKLTAYFTL